MQSIVEASSISGERETETRTKLAVLSILLVSCGITPLVPKSKTGRLAKQTELYGTVALVTTQYFQFCSGTAIAPRVIVTAAHCVVRKGVLEDYTEPIEPSDLYVSSGRYIQNNPFNRFIEVSRIYVHSGFPNPSWKGGTIANLRRWDDIALLILAKPVRVSWVSILPMAHVNALEVGSKVMISGYRRSALSIGRTTFRGRTLTELWVGRRGEPHHVKGNSGGPVYVRLGGRLYLIGAASRITTIGSIATIVPAYLKWIKSKTKLPTGPAPPPVPASCSQVGGSSSFLWLLLLLLWMKIHRVTRRGNR